ncbi:7361_t:CDS:2 [Paraglomus brasilianum]|uniref:7361_t:CDS:1 n=1 Tax=Paraglomus brasilianum TaxID=144538 RepID=A0A9N9F4A7_9GLOM|nr:7361_t:CDS:2 [Paraglomus brasilianum]
MNPVIQKYLEEVELLKSSIALKKASQTKRRDHPIGIYYDEDGKPQLQLPSPPDEPTPTDCCSNGCTPCVFDVYREELQAHNEQVDMLRKEYTKICKNDNSIVDLESLRLPLRNSAADKVTSRKQYIGYKVLEKSQISHDTILIVGKVPLSSSREQRSLGIEDGEHVLIRMKLGNETITKAFTPITHPSVLGEFHLMVKLYNDHKPSEYLKSLRVNDLIYMRGPIMSGFKHTNNSNEQIVMLAAGSGITPMYQIILKQSTIPTTERTAIHLVYVNRTEHDIWLKSELDKQNEEDYLTTDYVLTRTEHINNDGRYIRGKLNRELLYTLLDRIKRCDKCQILICGPRSFNADMKSHMENIGYGEGNIFCYE